MDPGSDPMPIALTEEHGELARVARSFLETKDARSQARALLLAPSDQAPLLEGLGLARVPPAHRLARTSPVGSGGGARHFSRAARTESLRPSGIPTRA